MNRKIGSVLNGLSLTTRTRMCRQLSHMQNSKTMSLVSARRSTATSITARTCLVNHAKCQTQKSGLMQRACCAQSECPQPARNPDTTRTILPCSPHDGLCACSPNDGLCFRVECDEHVRSKQSLPVMFSTHLLSNSGSHFGRWKISTTAW